jgi:hypothetical protein
MTYRENRDWSDAYIPEICKIVGPRLLVTASFEVDTKQATDLILLKARDMRIAARVRRPGYAARYPFEFTVRSRHDSGAKTEFAKMLEGFGDWMFYGHAHPQNAGEINRWMLIDLAKWREFLSRTNYSGGWAPFAIPKSNGDGTHFIAFDIRKMPEVVIASSTCQTSGMQWGLFRTETPF